MMRSVVTPCNSSCWATPFAHPLDLHPSCPPPHTHTDNSNGPKLINSTSALVTDSRIRIYGSGHDSHESPTHAEANHSPSLSHSQSAASAVVGVASASPVTPPLTPTPAFALDLDSNGQAANRGTPSVISPSSSRCSSSSSALLGSGSQPCPAATRVGWAPVPDFPDQLQLSAADSADSACARAVALDSGSPASAARQADHHPTVSNAHENLYPTSCGPYVKAPIYVDYGINVHIGSSTFINRNCHILDSPVAKLVIGERVLLGPNVHLYNVTHTLDMHHRTDPSYHSSSLAGDIVIGDDCWIGENPSFLILHPDWSCSSFSLPRILRFPFYALPQTLTLSCLHHWPDVTAPLQNLFTPTKLTGNSHIGGGATILPGVTIGNGSVIGAGSVVTRNVPAHHLAVGVPARVIRKLKDDDCQVDLLRPIKQLLWLDSAMPLVGGDIGGDVWGIRAARAKIKKLELLTALLATTVLWLWCRGGTRASAR